MELKPLMMIVFLIGIAVVSASPSFSTIPPPDPTPSPENSTQSKVDIKKICREFHYVQKDRRLSKEERQDLWKAEFDFCDRDNRALAQDVLKCLKDEQKNWEEVVEKCKLTDKILGTERCEKPDESMAAFNCAFENRVKKCGEDLAGRSYLIAFMDELQLKGKYRELPESCGWAMAQKLSNLRKKNDCDQSISNPPQPAPPLKKE